VLLLGHQPPPQQLDDRRSTGLHHPRQRLGNPQQRVQHVHRGGDVFVPDLRVTEAPGARPELSATPFLGSPTEALEVEATQLGFTPHPAPGEP
jgi:hypothetical protein